MIQWCRAMDIVSLIALGSWVNGTSMGNRPAQVFPQVPRGASLGYHPVSGKYLEFYRSACGGAEVPLGWRVADVEGTKDGCGLQETMSCHGSHETSFGGVARYFRIVHWTRFRDLIIWLRLVGSTANIEHLY